MRILLLVTAAVMLLGVLPANVKAIDPTVVDFDDLERDQGREIILSGTNYAGLNWEWGDNVGPYQGQWRIPPEGIDIYPYSEPHAVTGGYGASLMGIGFGEPVNVLGAYFAGAINSTFWTPCVRAHGYLDDVEVAITDWFEDINETPDWFAMNLNNVDRIVIESVLHPRVGLDPISYYSMDNLTYVPEPGTIALLALGAIFFRRRK